MADDTKTIPFQELTPGAVDTSDHTGDEHARIWRHSALHGIELFKGSYRKHQFSHHFHPVPAIGVVERGSMACFCRGQVHLVPAGTVILFNPGEVHAPGPANSDSWAFRSFFIDEDVFRARSAELGQSSLRFSTPFANDRRLAASLLRLHRDLEGDRTPLEMESSLSDIFSQIAEKHTDSAVQENRPENENRRLNRVKEYLHANYMQEISLVEHLAPVAQFSPTHLLRAFRSFFGLTPHAYLTQVRIEAGKHLLRAGNSISAVSASTGFTDQSHFTRHFKRIMGVTPGKYLPRLLRG